MHLQVDSAPAGRLSRRQHWEGVSLNPPPECIRIRASLDCMRFVVSACVHYTSLKQTLSLAYVRTFTITS